MKHGSRSIYLSDFTMQTMTGRGVAGRGKAKSKNRSKNRNNVSVLKTPMLAPSMIAVLAGLLVTALGCGLCVLGFYSESLSMTSVTNGTMQTTVIDRSKYSVYHSMGYVGPVVIGAGCFIVIVAVVVILDSWDQLKRDMPKIAENNRKNHKHRVYDSIIKQLKGAAQVSPESQAIPAIKTEDHNDHDTSSALSKFIGTIGRTLKRKHSSKSDGHNLELDNSTSSLARAIGKIPMELFTAVPLSSQSRKDFMEELETDPRTRDINCNKTPTLDTRKQFLNIDVPDKTATSAHLLKPPTITKSIYSSNLSISDTFGSVNISKQLTAYSDSELNEHSSVNGKPRKLPPLKIESRSPSTPGVNETKLSAMTSKHTSQDQSTLSIDTKYQSEQLKMFPRGFVRKSLYNSVSLTSDDKSSSTLSDS